VPNISVIGDLVRKLLSVHTRPPDRVLYPVDYRVVRKNCRYSSKGGNCVEEIQLRGLTRCEIRAMDSRQDECSIISSSSSSSVSLVVSSSVGDRLRMSLSLAVAATVRAIVCRCAIAAHRPADGVHSIRIIHCVSKTSHLWLSITSTRVNEF